MERIKRDDNQYKDVICIYKITNNVTGKVYIGSTINLKKRINNHISTLNLNTHTNSILQNDWNKYQSDKFSFEIVEKINDISLLPITEKKYIDLYKNKTNVYNVSDPLEEFDLRKANKKQKINKTKKKTRLVTYKYMMEYINNNFEDLANKMKESISERKYFYKDDVENWIINNIKNEDVRNDDRLTLALHKWYNKILKFSVIKSNMYRREFKELYGLSIEPNKELLVSYEISNALYNKKINKYKK